MCEQRPALPCRMARSKIDAVGFDLALRCLVVIFCTCFLVAMPTTAETKPASAVRLAAKLQPKRTSPTDLEVGGELAGVPAGATRYLRREDLLALPQVAYTVHEDSNFIGPTQVSGVPLSDLVRDLGAAPSADLAIAICDDGYRANYSRAYLEEHRPVLVLSINGRPPSSWPKDSDTHTFDMGPYLISHAKFMPAFKVLAHSDEVQNPWGVVRFELHAEKEVLGAIAPRGPHASGARVQAGFKIAQQNCFRCHNMGAQGGQKSGIAWGVLASVAASSPEFFTAYVRNPATTNPKTRMSSNPEYDDATVNALIAYFSTFAVPATAGKP